MVSWKKEIANPVQTLFDIDDVNEYKLGLFLDEHKLQDVNEKDKNFARNWKTN